MYLCVLVCVCKCVSVYPWCIGVYLCRCACLYIHIHIIILVFIIISCQLPVDPVQNFLEGPDKEWQVNEEGNMVEGHCPLLCVLETLTVTQAHMQQPVLGQPGRLPFPLPAWKLLRAGATGSERWSRMHQAQLGGFVLNFVLL